MTIAATEPAILKSSHLSIEETVRHEAATVQLATPKPLYQFVKRLMDICVACIALFILSPLFFIAAVLVRLTSQGPIFFCQERVGLLGREFTCFKFRSMVVNADEIKETLSAENQHEDPRTFKMKRDPRVTLVGCWLRRTSIDEMPQLLNVIKGDMSLVGPRPPVPDEVRLYSAHNLGRLAVKPGLTCIWQVSGRGDVGFTRQVEMDLEYIRRRSTWLDLKLIFLTVPALLSCRGAY